MRLHRHDELVEAIHSVIAPWVSGHDIATAALDALLEAVMRLEVGEVSDIAEPDEPVLILRMEASDDK